jgi:hypothetical protein
LDGLFLKKRLAKKERVILGKGIDARLLFLTEVRLLAGGGRTSVGSRTMSGKAEATARGLVLAWTIIS